MHFGMTSPGQRSASTLGSRGRHALRNAWARGVRCPSQAIFAFAVSLIWALLYNFTFWRETVQAMWYPQVGAVVFLASLFVLLLTVQATLLLVVPTRRGMQAVASLLFVVAALSSYFSDAYGAIMNREMMHNVGQTDPAEVRGLIGISLIVHFVVFGLLPAILVWRVQMPRTGFLEQLKQRSLFFVIAWVLTAGGVLAASANYAVFLREHKPIRSLASPVSVVVNSIGVLAEAQCKEYTGPLINVGGRATRLAAQSSRPVVMFLVIGETARAANFALSGYARDTNPGLRNEKGLVYFGRATSCGTSTATSVPCIFSPLGRSTFDLSVADRYANLLDALAGAGLDVQWRDNNAGCKGVCTRVETIRYTPQSDASLCPNSYCFDDVMLKDLAEKLAHVTRDTLIVFHQIGSHGPAYSERYPQQFERFKPACKSNELHRCAPAEIVNAYDNSILYTDHVLSRQIDLLRAAARLDSVLIYASDHGESLGEQGVYLHGMPYSVAPRVQKEIPMLMWASESYLHRAGLEESCLQGQARLKVSHDNVYHTVLGVFGVRNRVYDGNLDLLAACRRSSASPTEVSGTASR